MRFLVRLTNAQRNAMMLVLIEQARNRNSTQEFIDVLTDSTVTLHDLLQLVTGAEVEAGD
jgi:hypothetical protein